MQLIRNLLLNMVNFRKDSSVITRIRLKRIAIFRDLLSPLPRPLRILDVGGTELFWEKMGFADDENYQITILNIITTESHHSNLHLVVGDAKDMSEFEDETFDVAISNSVIEHVGGPAEQRQMAKEVMRVGKRYFVQTPNRSFPFEPHYLFPFFQFFPLSFKVFLIRYWYPRISDKEQAIKAAKSVLLLSRSDIEDLFPGGEIRNEKLLGMTYSFLVYGGW